MQHREGIKLRSVRDDVSLLVDESSVNSRKQKVGENRKSSRESYNVVNPRPASDKLHHRILTFVAVLISDSPSLSLALSFRRAFVGILLGRIKERFLSVSF